MFLLDADICIYALKGMYPEIRRNLEGHSPATIGIPAIVKAELYFGAYKSSARERTLQQLDKFISPMTVVPFGDEEAVFYARIRSELEAEGMPIGPNDLIIAATAMSRGAILVTHNVHEFQRIRGLIREDWTS